MFSGCQVYIRYACFLFCSLCVQLVPVIDLNLAAHVWCTVSVAQKLLIIVLQRRMCHQSLIRMFIFCQYFFANSTSQTLSLSLQSTRKTPFSCSHMDRAMLGKMQRGMFVPARTEALHLKIQKEIELILNSIF